MKKLNVHINGDEGFQIEVDGVLLTLRPNEHHGIHGSLTFKERDKMQVFQFHGQDADTPFPVEFHEDTL